MKTEATPRAAELSFLKRRGLVLRLGAWYAIFYFTTFALLSYLGFNFIRRSLMQEDFDLMQAQVMDFREYYRKNPEQAFETYFSSEHRALFGIVYVRMGGDGEQVLLTDYPLANTDALKQSPIEPIRDKKTPFRSINLQGGVDLHVALFSFPVNEEVSIEIARNEQPHKRLLEAFLALSLLAAIPLAAVGLLGGAFFTKWALQPVREVNRAMRAILATGKFEERVQTKAHSGEMRDLIDLCNRLLAHCERLIKGMHQALDNVAHDLRTPLTRLRASTESALLGDEDSTRQREALADTLEETDQILTMLNTIMEVTAAESDLLELHYDEIGVAALVARVVDLFEFVAEEKNIQLRAAVADGMMIRADNQRLLQALSNLVDNAIKYTPAGGHVVIWAKMEGDKAVFGVKDDGTGIAPFERESIWDRLHRGDSSRHEKGLGLGLSMVKAIVLAHGGSVHVHSEVGQGAEFIISIPTPKQTDEEEH